MPSVHVSGNFVASCGRSLAMSVFTVGPLRHSYRTSALGSPSGAACAAASCCVQLVLQDHLRAGSVFVSGHQTLADAHGEHMTPDHSRPRVWASAAYRSLLVCVEPPSMLRVTVPDVSIQVCRHRLLGCFRARPPSPPLHPPTPTTHRASGMTGTLPCLFYIPCAGPYLLTHASQGARAICGPEHRRTESSDERWQGRPLRSLCC